MQDQVISAEQSGKYVPHPAEAGIYDEFIHRMQLRLDEVTQGGTLQLFTTDTSKLYAAYLNSFSNPAFRQYHNCHCCRQFIERFGGLVVIDSDGDTIPVMWNPEDAPLMYKAAVFTLNALVRRAPITGLFITSDTQWGTAQTGPWTHFAIDARRQRMYKKRGLLDASQYAAEKRMDYNTVSRAVSEFSMPLLNQVVTLLEADVLYRSEKVLGQAVWLRDLRAQWEAAHGQRRHNVVWQAIATAPAGFCHPRSSMIGTLLSDLGSGMSFDLAAKRFADNMHPLQYQRPKAAPAAGAIAQAEKLFAEMGLAPALHRRYAGPDDVVSIWTPPVKVAPAIGGVFGHLAPKGTTDPKPLDTGARVSISFDKFRKTVLSTAERVEFLVPRVQFDMVVLTTAADPSAPPIHQWDSEQHRNPVAWYRWHGGSLASEFNLTPGAWVDVQMVVLMPHMWNENVTTAHYGKEAVFVLPGAKESRDAGNAIFPETLRSELHGVRSVIEAYSKGAKILDSGVPLVAGPAAGGRSPLAVRVTSGGVCLHYLIDRWD